MEIWSTWHPSYWLSGAIKAVTAVASVITAILLVRLIPQIPFLVSLSAFQNAKGNLKASEDRFRLLVDGVTDYALLMLDPGGHVISWNSGAECIKGYKATEIIGKHFSCFYLPLGQSLFQDVYMLGWSYRTDQLPIEQSDSGGVLAVRLAHTDICSTSFTPARFYSKTSLHVETYPYGDKCTLGIGQRSAVKRSIWSFCLSVRQ